MRNTIALLLIFIALIVFNSPGLAQDNETPKWDTQFVHELETILAQQKTGGLGYTVSQEEGLENAIKKAMEQKAPPCEAMKLAVDLNFNPYNVVSGIFSSGADVDLDQLCMCATESGITKSLMAQAATAAVEANRLTRDEVTQAQCLREGLGFTPEAVALAPPAATPEKPPSRVSPSGTTSG